MSKFTPEQAVAVIEIQQLINEWSYELDVNNGINIASLITEDCSYLVRGGVRTSRDAVAQFYKERLEGYAATPEGAPIHRHMLANLRVSFTGADAAAIGFSLLYFSTLGMKAGTDHADPASAADVRMDVRRDAGGEWRIAKFDSNMTFRRVLA
ncbi:nuclear transport factor 2 family protein [Acidocella sp.]|uniref:nuclear transport factor 2 family protein n=1 Tax=Acidocella sp. TaxID=50710 RepID=UPI00261610D0|nr:nuclear transport factor 2 family protein [Acidocella sp.]